MQITNNNIAIPQVLKTPEARKNAAKIGASALITSSAVMLATKAPKLAAKNPIPMPTRLAKAGIAGLLTAAAVSVITLVDKNTIVQGVNKVKEVFRRNPAEKELDNTKPIEAAETKAPAEEVEQQPEVEQQEQQGQEEENPFKDSEKVKIPVPTEDSETQASSNPAPAENPAASNEIASTEAPITQSQTSNPFAQNIPTNNSNIQNLLNMKA